EHITDFMVCYSSGGRLLLHYLPNKQMGRIVSITGALFALALLNACHTAKRITNAHAQKNPRFIDEVTIGGKGSNNIHMRVIEGPHEVHEPDGTIIITRKERKELQDKYAGKVGVHDRDIQNLSLYTFI